MPPLGSFRTASGRSITASGAEFTAEAEKSFGKQLYREGQGILAASQGLVPVDTSALRSSGYVTPPAKEDGFLEVLIGYGGPAAKINPKTLELTDGYALYVHENLEAHHPVGTAKFLELPFNQATRGMGERIAAGMRADLKTNANVGDYVVGEAEADYVF